MRRIVWFVALAFLFSWAWWIPMAMTGTIVDPGQGWPTHLPGLLGPALAAIVVTGAFEGRPGLADLWSRVARWRVRWVWYALVGATAAMSVIPLLLSPGIAPAAFAVYSGAPAIGLPVVLYVLLVNGFGEEIGWRGFLADQLLGRTSRGVTALVVWPVWAVWHLPMFWVVGNFRDLGVAGTIAWVLGIGFGSVFLTWLYQSSSRSILIVALWHTAYNFTTATDATAGTAAAVSSTLVVIASIAILALPSTWRRQMTSTDSSAISPSTIR